MPIRCDRCYERARFPCADGRKVKESDTYILNHANPYSHAIGHQLGPLGVGHGETSCILLPAVCKYNAEHHANDQEQKKVLDILWRIPEVQSLASIDQKTADLGDILDAFVRELGLPRTLKEVGVGRDRIEALALTSLHDRWAVTNPVPLTEKRQVLEILERVLG